MIIAILLGSLYVWQRIIWMGAGNAHYAAKEYWVAGQVVFAHRKIAEKFIRPDNILRWPYNKLQEIIFEKGSALLPKDDGEIGVWKIRWFIYPYIRNRYAPPGAGNLKMKQNVVSMLDKCWHAMDKMASNAYFDNEMRRWYLLRFAETAAFYDTYRWH